MAETMVMRRLAAILAADIAGYSRLMGEDEVSTVRDLKAHQAVLLPLVEQYGGRIIDTAGDGILAEFPSVIHSVECAVQIQTLMAGRNRDVPESRRMLLRIGINVGDVIHDESRIYGDGINVAARLEGIADPGGICISSKVREEIGSKLSLSFRDLGFQALKNIANPIHAYAVELSGDFSPMAPKPAGKRVSARTIAWAVVIVAILIVGAGSWFVLMRPALVSPSAGPPLMSIAVMPFSPASGGSDDERFAERLTQDVTSALQTSMRFAPVSSAGLAAKYKVRPADPRTVGNELNVRYILDGDVRDQGKTIVVATRLIETSSAAQLWNELVAVPRSGGDGAGGEIVAQLTNRVRVALDEAERKRVARLPATAASTAMELTLRADELWEREGRSKGAAPARKLYEEALRHDPNSVDALVGLYGANITQLQDDPAADYGALAKSRDELSLRAVRADRNDSRAWRIRSESLVMQGKWDEALEAIAEALRIDPYRDETLFEKAHLLIVTARSAEALPILDQLIALSPRSPSLAYFHHHKCFANMHLRRYEQAAAACEKGRALDDYWFFHLRLMAAYALSGDMAKALEAKAEVLKRQPTISIARIREMRASTHPTFLQERETTFIAGLRKAGIPEE